MSEENDNDGKERLGELENQIRTDIQKLKDDINKTLETSKSSMEKLLKAKSTSEIPLISEEKASFLDYFGNVPKVEKSRIKLNKSNLIKSIAPFLKDVNLRTIFLYISVLKMLKVDISDRFIEQAFKVMKKQTHQKIFTSLENQNPDPKSIFFGLATILELIQYGDVDFIDLNRITNHIQSELNHFDPEELHKNYYLLNCVNILIRINQEITIDKQQKIREIMDIDLNSLPEFDPIRDLYKFLSCITLMNSGSMTAEVKNQYYRILENYINNRKISKLTITEAAQTLLIIDLLGKKNEATQIIENLLTHVNNTTTYFSTDNKVKNFSWEEEILALIVELRMVFYALLANYQYKSL